MWSRLTEDEKTIFEDPIFWALAGIPDPAKWSPDQADDWEDLPEDVDISPAVQDSQVYAPEVATLTASQESKYRPLFEKLVDAERLLVNYGKPEEAPEEATEDASSERLLVTKSRAAFQEVNANVRLLYQSHPLLPSADVLAGFFLNYSLLVWRINITWDIILCVQLPNLRSIQSLANGLRLTRPAHPLLSMLTRHWVSSLSFSAMSVNISTPTINPTMVNSTSLPAPSLRLYLLDY